MSIDSFDNLSKKYGFSLTPLRREVINIFLKHGKSLKANEIINYINATGKNTKSIVIYRVLNFLVEKKVIHKIQSQNIFILCKNSICNKNNGNKIFLLCNKCRQIQEIGNEVFIKNIEEICHKHNFILKNSTVDIDGYCRRCMI